MWWSIPLKLNDLGWYWQTLSSTSSRIVYADNILPKVQAPQKPVKPPSQSAWIRIQSGYWSEFKDIGCIRVRSGRYGQSRSQQETDFWLALPTELYKPWLWAGKNLLNLPMQSITLTSFMKPLGNWRFSSSRNDIWQSDFLNLPSVFVQFSWYPIPMTHRSHRLSSIQEFIESTNIYC